MKSNIAQEAIKTLVSNGIPEHKISTELKSVGFSTSQPTVHRWKTGQYRIPFEEGLEILKIKQRLIDDHGKRNRKERKLIIRYTV